MRVVKEAEERKNEILDAAEELFDSKGFDRTSTNDILEKVGIARGTLYYHFKSKEDILDAVIQRMLEKCMAAARKVASDSSLPLLERLPLTIMALRVDNSLGEDVMQQMHKPQNALMHQKMQNQLLNGVVPIITELAEEGIREGIFQTECPSEAVEMTLLYSDAVFDNLMEQTPEQRDRRIAGFIYNVERLFGTEKGALQSVLMKIFLRS